MRAINRSGKQDGFTLVELMIVFGIIAILIGIAVASYTVSVRSSMKTACKADLHVIRGQLNAYRDRHGAFPPDLRDLVPDFVENEKGLHCPASGNLYDYDPDTGQAWCSHPGHS